MEQRFTDILANFQLDGAAVSCERYGFGHINETYLVVTTTSHRYILQKINNYVFKNVPALMDNIAAVTSFLQTQETDSRRVLQLIPTISQENYLEYDGGFWRIYDFVEESICLQLPETSADFYESAVAFGRFQQMLGSFPAHTLHETIPNFHNTADRYRQLHEAMEADTMGRLTSVQQEVEFALARESEAGTLVNMQKQGLLPLRVTHNDTKLNNVMLDNVTRKALCVIDLDTVMPGLSAYDFGDSIRFGAATAAEDETDLAKMEMDLGLFQIYAEGFLSACPGLTQAEKEILPLGAKLMTLECGVRFLTDYLNGDTYFKIHRPDHNLDRCRTQFKLVADMESKWEQMQQVIKNI